MIFTEVQTSIAFLFIWKSYQLNRILIEVTLVKQEVHMHMLLKDLNSIPTSLLYVAQQIINIIKIYLPLK